MMPVEMHYKAEGGVATITMNRPDRRNAFNMAMLEALDGILDEIGARTDARVIILRGEGTVFCSGVDLREFGSRPDMPDLERWIISVFRHLEQIRQPTIAMIQGDALAGGCELALHCDLRVASDAARFSVPVARLGFLLPFAFTQKLVEIVGPAFARQILFTGQPISAKRAYEIGMIHQLVSPDEVEAASYGLARTIAENAPLSLAGLKAMIQRDLSLRDTIEHQDIDEIVKRSQRSADAVEGVTAMLEKRKPVFRGE